MEQSAPYQRVTYPVSRDIFVVRATGTSVYTYNFVKLSKESNWELVKAWMMNQDGERTEIKLDQAGK
ncbi:MAG: hypothetical protein JWO95_962 [Verrucomicrobiales bacterium]|nr:hypothetical protein [Verrucomicrobiales bacterium]